MWRMESVIDTRLNDFAGEQRKSLEHLRDTLRRLLPDAVECLSYGLPTFKVGGKSVASFDGFKNHSSYFPCSGNVLERLDSLPDWCEVSRGTLRFPTDRRLPVALVRRLVKERLSEIAAAEKTKSARRR